MAGWTVEDALADGRAEVRLRAALDTGARPEARYVGVLVARCAVEPAFEVREVLTWAITRHPAEATVPLLMAEVRSGGAQARSQALHTLSKIGDPRGWEVITAKVLADADDEVARSAWRAATALVPDGEKGRLATELTAQLGRGGHDTRRSLSRALVALGDMILPSLRHAAAHADPDVRAHALATERLLADPEAGFASLIEEAKRAVALHGRGPGG
ncbi:HEAT repeat domain-containing protein [Streptomyces sp. NPDC060194]|uniref:HEAT repeat domain-containing protein n=1 Tax=Streptomyces sp. NPDC060194 TaxID=3347069 RepID=UPI003656A786